MASTEVLELILAARYIGRPAFSALSQDIEGVVQQSNALTRVGAAFSALGDLMITAGVGIGVGLGVAVKQAAEYEQGLARIQSVTGYTTPQMQQLSDVIMKTSDTYGQSSQDIVNGTYTVLSGMGALGASFQDVINAQILPAIGAYVEASGAGRNGAVSWTDAATGLHTILAGMHAPLTQWANDMGILNAVENNSAINQQQLIAGFSRLAPVAGMLNLPFNQAAAMIGALGSSGVMGARAGTEASSGFTQMMTSPTAQKELAKLGLTSQDFFSKSGQLADPTTMMAMLLPRIVAQGGGQAGMLTAFTDIFGRAGGRAMDQFAVSGGGGVSTLQIYQKLLKIEGTGNQAYTQMLRVASEQASGPQAKFDILKAALQNLAITVGSQLMPQIMNLVTWLTNATLRLTDWVNSLKPEELGKILRDALIGLVGGGVGLKASGGVLSMLGGHLSAVSQFNKEGAAGVAESNAANLTKAQGRYAQDAESIARQNQAALDRAASINQQNAQKYASALTGWQNSIADGNNKIESILAKDVETKTQAFEQAAAKWDAAFGKINTTAGQKAEAVMSKADADMRSAGTSVGGGLNFKQGQIHDKALKDVEAIFGESEGQKAALGSRPELSQFLTPFNGTLPAMPIRPVKDAEEVANLVEQPEFAAPELEKFVGKKSIFGNIGGIFASMFQGGAGVGKDLKGKGKGLGGFLGHILGSTSDETGKEFTGFIEHHKTRGLKALSEHFPTAMANMFMEQGAEHDKHPALGFLGGAAKDVGGMAKGGIGNMFGGLAGGIKNLVGGIPALIGMLPELAAGFAAVAIPVMVIIGIIAIIVLTFINFRHEAMETGATIGKQLSPIFKLFAGIFQTAIQSIKKAWDAAWPSIEKAMMALFANLPKIVPLLQLVGGVIGGVLAVVVAVIVGVINGVIKALPFIIGFISSIISFVGDFIKIIFDLFTNWNAIPGDLQNLWNDILGIFKNAALMLWNLVLGIIQGIIGFFEMLWDKLTKHSIIPDMINDIINWFLKLPSQLGQLVLNLINNLINLLKSGASNIITGAESIGNSIITGITNGINNLLGNLKNTVTNAASSAIGWFKNVLGIHSPSTVFTEIGTNVVMGYIIGLQSQQSAVQSAWSNIVVPSSSAGTMPGPINVNVGGGASTGMHPSQASYSGALAVQQERYNRQSNVQNITQSSLLRQIDLQYRYAYQASA